MPEPCASHGLEDTWDMKRQPIIESHTLPGMAEDVDRQAESAAELSGEELTAKLREPLADISKRTGKLEKDSPLFFGTGENPSLF